MPFICKYDAEGQTWHLEAEIDGERHLGSNRWESAGCLHGFPYLRIDELPLVDVESRKLNWIYSYVQRLPQDLTWDILRLSIVHTYP